MIDTDALKRDKRPQSAWVVHALIDRLEAAEKERDALRAKIETMEKQGPAYWGPKHAIEGGSTTVIVGKFPVNPTDTPLYALPGAKGEEK